MFEMKRVYTIHVAIFPTKMKWMTELNINIHFHFMFSPNSAGACLSSKASAFSACPFQDYVGFRQGLIADQEVCCLGTLFANRSAPGGRLTKSWRWRVFGFVRCLDWLLAINMYIIYLYLCQCGNLDVVSFASLTVEILAVFCCFFKFLSPNARRWQRTLTSTALWCALQEIIHRGRSPKPPPHHWRVGNFWSGRMSCAMAHGMCEKVTSVG